jgi:hypothetical protein
VVTLKKSVPADWTMADHQAARPPPGELRSARARRLWSAPPTVNRIEPTKNVIASAESPTSWTYPGNGPTRKHVEPSANESAIHRLAVTRGILAHTGRRGGGTGSEVGVAPQLRTTVMGHVGPGARAIRPSAVTSGTPRPSATAT